MRIFESKLRDAVLMEPEVHSDLRGWFYESYSYNALKQHGLTYAFVQDNRAMSEQRGTLRGLHCQVNPMAQGKLINCTRGAILDIAVDLRQGSPTFMQWTAAELTQENHRMFYIPRGFLHGYVTLTEQTEVFYKVDRQYSREHDRTVRFDDPALGIQWGVMFPILSAKDADAPLLHDTDIRFIYKEDTALLYT